MKLTGRCTIRHLPRRFIYARGPVLVSLACIWLVLPWVMSGCSHYGYADSEVAVDQGRGAAVSVWTVAAPADEGLDQAKLTRTLTGAIRRQGVDAHWRDQALAASIRCSVSATEVSGFEQSLFARAQVDCDVGRAGEPSEQFEASGRYVASAGDRASALVQNHTALQEAAAIDALETAANQIARFVLHSRR